MNTNMVNEPLDETKLVSPQAAPKKEKLVKMKLLVPMLVAIPGGNNISGKKDEIIEVPESIAKSLEIKMDMPYDFEGEKTGTNLTPKRARAVRV